MKHLFFLTIGLVGFLYSQAQIVGPTQVCAGANGYLFSVPGVANSSSFVWSHSTNISISSGQGTNTVTLIFTDVGASADGYNTVDGNTSSGGTLQVAINGGILSYSLAITFLDDETCNACYCYDDLHINPSLLAVTNAAPVLFQAENRLSSDGYTPDGSEVTYHAEQLIELNPGFETGTSALFTGELAPCVAEGKNISPFSFCQDDPNPIGGGYGYSDILTAADADIVITSFTTINNFKQTIETAPPGSIIYINDNVTINLTGQYAATGANSIRIPAGVTIASGRGNGSSQGALIFTDDFDFYTSISNAGQPAFVCNGDNIRLTGFRFKGPYQQIGTNSPLSSIRFKTGITTIGFDGLEVDNCELYGWPYAAVRYGHGYGSGSLTNNKMHHNYIHHNRQHGLGYGAIIDLGYAEIYGNLMQANRHVIAGSGKDGSGYEAYCNTILTGGTSHNFDMHAEGPSDGTPNAGDFVYIHHNDFLDIGESRVSSTNKQNIYIRGRPDLQCRIENNRFRHEDPSVAIYQRNSHGGYGNVLAWNNIYGGTKYKGWYVKEEWNKTDASNFMNITSSNDAIFVPGSGSLYQYNYTFGDYDGDGKTDIFKLENGLLYVMPLEIGPSGLTTDWQTVLSTGYPFSALRFGFYNGDNKTDVLYQSGNTVLASYGANTSWTPMISTGYPLSLMKDGDFNGDGAIDLLYATGASWLVSFGSNTSWQTINTSSAGPAFIAAGRFNGDANWDVFSPSGTQFRVSYSGTSSWQGLASSSATLNTLVIADLNGDNISDVIYPPTGIVSLGGAVSWQGCTTAIFPMGNFPYGSF